jgi:hypothetical protein
VQRQNILICATSCPTSADPGNQKIILSRHIRVCRYSMAQHSSPNSHILLGRLELSALPASFRLRNSGRMLQRAALLACGMLERYTHPHMIMITSVSWPLEQLTGRYLHGVQKCFGLPETRGCCRSTGGLVKFDNHSLGSSGTGKVGSRFDYVSLRRQSFQFVKSN